MLVRNAQMQSLSRAAFFGRLHAFLVERARLPAVRAPLPRREDIYALWNRIMDGFDTGSEYRCAVVLCYAFCRQCTGAEPIASVETLLAAADPEYDAKCWFEDSGSLRFSEFDLVPEDPMSAEARA